MVSGSYWVVSGVVSGRLGGFGSFHLLVSRFSGGFGWVRVVSVGFGWVRVVSGWFRIFSKKSLKKRCFPMVSGGFGASLGGFGDGFGSVG